MTTTYLTLKGVAVVLPDGRMLLADLNESLKLRPTGLVGKRQPSTRLCLTDRLVATEEGWHVEVFW